MANIDQKLEDSRRELLDLSTRNRLLAIPTESRTARVVHVVGEHADQVYRVLVLESRSMSFAEAPDSPKGRASSRTKALAARSRRTNADIEVEEDIDEDEYSLPQPGEESAATTNKRQRDLKLQTTLSSDRLQTRLLGLYRDAQLFLEEQGVNILYLAIGQLHWFEADSADTARVAPLILIPVQLSRKSAVARFDITATDDDPEDNLTLYEKLKADFGVELPRFDSDGEDTELLAQYFARVRQSIRSKERWKVVDDGMCLGFFSFSKFLMYRDLDPNNWPEANNLRSNANIVALLDSGFESSAGDSIPEDAFLDDLVTPERMDQVVDADGSQTRTIEMVRKGHNLVIQGPPGTGKSQSIANILATAALDGKRVLFIAEKLAALSVVKRRLDAVKLGDLCLELHSNKANKKSVLSEIKRTWELGRPEPSVDPSMVTRLAKLRQYLNQHAKKLHETLRPSGMTPYAVLGRLSRMDRAWLQRPALRLEDARSWSREDIEHRRGVVQQLANALREVGIPSAHPWFGAHPRLLLITDLPAIEELVNKLSNELVRGHEGMEHAASTLAIAKAKTMAEADRHRRLLEHVARAPKIDRIALQNHIWELGITQIEEIVGKGLRLSQLKQDLGDQLGEVVLDMEWTDIRAAVTSHGQSLWRFLNGDYRRAMAIWRKAALGRVPKNYEERVSLLEKFVEARSLRVFLRQSQQVGQQAFGALWMGENSAWTQLAAIAEWVAMEQREKLLQQFRSKFASLDVAVDYAEVAKDLADRLNRLREAIIAFSKAVDFRAREVWPRLGDQPNDIAWFYCPLDEVTHRVAGWKTNIRILLPWSQWSHVSAEASKAGLTSVVDQAIDGRLQADEVDGMFERSFLDVLLQQAKERYPGLSAFEGTQHDRLIAEFRTLDRQRLAYARDCVLQRHYSKMPSKNTGIGAIGILRGEMERKRGHRSIRRLLTDAGSTVQAIKPIFMMSPLSVAQHLAPGAVEFDLLVIDEASQVEPVDALGAFARAKQCVVVGDSQQLPPTKFFARITSDVQEDYVDNETGSAQSAQAKRMESILSLCLARGLPQSMLRWHYRSRHHSLIAVSNQEFYNNKLFIVPSPRPVGTSGLRFNFVPDGVYDRGGSATNAVEARQVCQGILRHVRSEPHRTLGVAAFSLQQCKLIQDQVELLRRENQEVEAFCNSHPLEPFFVKNLESVQGDERDVIFISVGYGKDASGYMAMNFGPLSAERGERRLNVLISRAKLRCEVFSSIRAEDIDLQRVTGRGVPAFRLYLQYAEGGKLSQPEVSGRLPDSDFETAVQTALVQHGYQVANQVGVAGFYIDLAVVDEACPGRYLAGIECDGAAYHSSRSARDRDRLRQAVLEDHGWTILRVWSTDWFQRPEASLARLLQRLEGAKAQSKKTPPEGAASPEVAFSPTAEGIEVIRRPSEPTPEATPPRLGVPYREANFAVPQIPPHELKSEDMGKLVLRILEAEAPIHRDEIVSRVRDLWNLGRAGSRIQTAVSAAIDLLLSRRACLAEEEFISFSGRKVVIRSREATLSTGLRKPEYLPPSEVRQAIRECIELCHGASADDVTIAVSQAFGFKARSQGLKQVIERQIESLVEGGAIQQRESGLYELVISSLTAKAP